MNWYDGNIGEAIAKSRQEGAVFGVAIFGDDDGSKVLETSIGSEDVQKTLKAGKFTVIRITADSEEHRQFSRIYPDAGSPSIYLIGEKGGVLEVISGPNSSNEVAAKLNSAWIKHTTPVAPVSNANSNIGRDVNAAGVGSATAGSSSISTAQALVNANEAVKMAEESAGQSDISLEERIERAQKLANAKRQQKLAQEAEDERQRERERREMGKGISDLKRWQKEEEAKQMIEQRKKEKREEVELRQRLKEQIAQDRAARNARTNVSFINDGPTNPNQPTATAGPRPAGVISAPTNYIGKARLQFRLPGGSSISHVFEPTVTLTEVRNFLVDNNHVTFRQFTLSVAYPRREFSTTEYSSYIRDLGLVPSATLLVLPISSGSSMPGLSGGFGLASIQSWVTLLIGYILIPFQFVFSFIQRALPSTSPAPSTRNPGNRPVPRRTVPEPAASSSSVNSNKSESDTSSADIRNRKPNKGKTDNPAKTSDGNVHSLRNQEDSDDDPGTWNGNSTQQM